ncbi:MAG: ABC transporter permease [Blastocatellia bacterium]|nr:ABC transporter permease [Blastocatellia bacterium]
MQTLWQDLRFGARMLLMRPGFSLIAALTLALGFGACTAIFSVVDAVLLRSMPYPDADRVVQLREVSEDGAWMAFTDPNFRDVRERNRSLEAVAEYAGSMETITGGSEPLRARALMATNDFFRALGVAPLAGRAFLPEDAKDGGKRIVVVSYNFWQRALGGRADLAGVKLRISDRVFDVVGVMPQGFSYPRGFDVWGPRELFPPETSRSGHNWEVFARLKRGVTLAQARADLSAIAGQIKQENGKEADAVNIAAIPLREFTVGDTKNILLIVLAAVGFLLMVACANVANLLLAQATARRKEFAVRAALGATRLRLAAQFVTENALLALIAGALGALLAVWGVDLLIGLNPGSMPRADEIGVDARALGFTIGLALFIAVALGLAPVSRLSQNDLHDNLKDSGRGQTGHSNRLRGALVVAQMALTLALLTGAGLLGKSFYRLLQVDPGFRAESAVVMDLSLPSYTGPDRGEQVEFQRRQRLFYQQLLDGLSKLPGVVAVGGSTGAPMDGDRSNGTFLIDNNPAKTGYADYRTASAGYFAAMGIPLLRGRVFDESDKPEAPHVAVISRSLAQKYWPNEDPISKRIQFGNMDGDPRLFHIVGVVGDVRGNGLDADAQPMVYGNALQRPIFSEISIVVRAQADPATLTPALSRTVRALNPELPVSFRTLQQIFSSSLDQRRFSLVIFSVFAAVALTLAVMGVYSVMAYAVAERTKEIGVRMALGAPVKDILILVMRQGGKLIATGATLGVIGSLLLTRLLTSMLYGVSAADPATFAGVALSLAGVALLACYIPARRAAKVDPMVALRRE